MADIIEVIKRAALDAVNADNPVALLFGEVTLESPLEITVEPVMTLKESQLVLTRNVTEHTIEMTVDHWTEHETQHTHGVIDTYTGGGYSLPTSHRHAYSGRKKFLLHNGLKLGEKVILIRLQGGQKYLVIDRVG